MTVGTRGPGGARSACGLLGAGTSAAVAVSVLRQVIDGGNAGDTATSAPAFAIRVSTGPVARR
ncbi:hypothetical protein [Amycolatopsis sp. NPDC051716]|uniref:hypothetical protein n=1 Tax=Amycolatopsis sp. NPDC051716 TaxID=3155804 RepID=UPI0034170BEA